MPRPKRPRYIESHLGISGFTPDGVPHTGDAILTIEELEAIRLSDYLGLDQSQASEQMKVSRQTFGRILKQARYNLAEALLTGKRLKVAGGCYEMHGRHRRRGGSTDIIEEETMVKEENNKNTETEESERITGQGRGQGRGPGQGQGRRPGRGQGQGRCQGGEGCRQGKPSQETNK